MYPAERNHWQTDSASSLHCIFFLCCCARAKNKTKALNPSTLRVFIFLSISHWWLIYVHCISLVNISWLPTGSTLHWVRFCLLRGACDWYKTLQNRFDPKLLVWIKWNGEIRYPNRSDRSLFSLDDRAMYLFMIGSSNQFQKKFRPIRNQSVIV